MLDPLSARPAVFNCLSDDYHCVVVCLGRNWRLASTASGDGYSLHRRVETSQGWRWVIPGVRSPKTLPKIAAKYGREVDGLAAVCAALPDRPYLFRVPVPRPEFCDFPRLARRRLPDGRRVFDVAAETGVPLARVDQRLRRGWPLDRAVSEPLRPWVRRRVDPAARLGRAADRPGRRPLAAGKP